MRLINLYPIPHDNMILQYNLGHTNSKDIDYLFKNVWSFNSAP